MSKPICLVLYVFLGTMLLYGCNSRKEQDIDPSSLVGSSIYQVGRVLEQQGFRVSEIDDPTGEGYLFMTVRIDDVSELDSLFHALGKDPRPWGRKRPSHLWIEANLDGVIKKVSAK